MARLHLIKCHSGLMPRFMNAAIGAATAAEGIYSGVSGRPDVVRILNEMLITDDINNIPSRAGGNRPWDKKPPDQIPNQTTVPHIPKTSAPSIKASKECE